MPEEIRGGVTVEDYLQRMDRAGIERSLLIAVRAGDINMKGGFELPYERVRDVCQQHPKRFSGLAGIDPFRGMQGLRDLERAVREYGFVGAHLYPHWCGLAPDHAKYYPYYAKCCELDVPIMMQVGHNLVYSRERRLPSVGRPICLDQVAIDFPELRLIGIHIGDSLDRRDDLHVLEARERLYRWRCLRAEALAQGLRALRQHLSAGKRYCLAPTGR